MSQADPWAQGSFPQLAEWDCTPLPHCTSGCGALGGLWHDGAALKMPSWQIGRLSATSRCHGRFKHPPACSGTQILSSIFSHIPELLACAVTQFLLPLFVTFSFLKDLQLMKRAGLLERTVSASQTSGGAPP